MCTEFSMKLRLTNITDSLLVQKINAEESKVSRVKRSYIRKRWDQRVLINVYNHSTLNFKDYILKLFFLRYSFWENLKYSTFYKLKKGKIFLLHAYSLSFGLSLSAFLSRKFKQKCKLKETIITDV